MQTAAKLARRGSQYFSSGATASSSTGEGVPGQDDGSGSEVNRPAETPQPPSPEASGEFALPSVLVHRQKLALTLCSIVSSTPCLCLCVSRPVLAMSPEDSLRSYELFEALRNCKLVILVRYLHNSTRSLSNLFLLRLPPLCPFNQSFMRTVEPGSSDVEALVRAIQQAPKDDRSSIARTSSACSIPTPLHTAVRCAKVGIRYLQRSTLSAYR